MNEGAFQNQGDGKRWVAFFATGGGALRGCFELRPCFYYQETYYRLLDLGTEFKLHLGGGLLTIMQISLLNSLLRR